MRAALTSGGVDDPRARKSLVHGPNGSLTIPVPPTVLDGALRGARLDDAQVLGAKPVSGGSINEAVRLRTTDGDFFLKWHPGMGSEIFRMEAEGLEALAASRTVAVPAVVARSSGGENVPWMLLEWIREGGPVQVLVACIGAQSGGASSLVGREALRLVVAQRHRNPRPAEWLVRRLVPVLGRKARPPARVGAQGRRSHHFGAADRDREPRGPAGHAPRGGRPVPTVRRCCTATCGRATSFFAEAGEAVLIDPAVYVGHREVDLAMCRLFGGFPATFYHAYAESWPLQPGHERRLPAYQLYPLLVHAQLFGGGYVPAALRAAETALAAC